MISSRVRQFVVAALLAVSVSVTVFAIRYGQPDNGQHPYVGIVVFYDQAGVPQWRCTGTLISPTLLLTAGHCTELERGAQVWFDEHSADLTRAGYPYTGGVTGTAHTYPEWEGGLYLPNTGDAGVVVLREPVTLPAGFSFPQLAPAGYLDQLATARGQKDVMFKVVGYGLQQVRPFYSAVRDRLWGWVQLVNLRSALTDGYNIQTTNAPGKGTGGSGTCFGDSGGAIFTGSNQIVAVNSFVLNDYCAGASFGYRVDRAEVQDWITSCLDGTCDE